MQVNFSEIMKLHEGESKSNFKCRFPVFFIDYSKGGPEKKRDKKRKENYVYGPGGGGVIFTFPTAIISSKNYGQIVSR